MSLLKGTLIYTLSNLTIKFGSVLLLPILTHLLTPEEYGLVGLFVTITSFITIILGCGFYTPLMRVQSLSDCDYKQCAEYKFTAFIFLIFIFIFVFALIFMLVNSGLVDSLLQEYKIDSTFLFLSIIISMVSSLNIIMNTSFRMDEKYSLVATLSMISFTVFYLGALILISKFHIGVLGYIYGNLISVIVVFILSFILYIKTMTFGYSWRKTLYLLKNGIPMVFIEMSDKIIETSDRIILVRFVSLSVLGVYTLATTGCKILNVVFSSYINAILPEIYKSTETKEHSKLLIKKLENAYLLMLILIAVGQLCSKEIIDLLFPVQYTGLFLLFISSLPAISLQYYFFLDFYFHTNEDSKFILLFTLCTSILNIVLNLIFVPKYGVYASIFSTYVAYLIRAIVEVKFVYARYNIRFGLLKIIIGSLALYIVPLLYVINLYEISYRVLISTLLLIYLAYSYKKMNVF